MRPFTTKRWAGLLGLTESEARADLEAWAQEKPDVLRANGDGWLLLSAAAVPVELPGDDGVRLCACGCGARIWEAKRKHAVYASAKCKQKAYRKRKQ